MDGPCRLGLHSLVLHIVYEVDCRSPGSDTSMIEGNWAVAVQLLLIMNLLIMSFTVFALITKACANVI